MKLASTLCGLLITCLLQAQDLNFSQFYELPLLRNPGLAGIYNGDVRVTSAFRSQWGSVTTPYVSQALGGEMKFAVSRNKDNYISVGLQITNDRAGDSKFGKTQFLPLLAYHRLLNAENNTYLSVGFLAGPVQERFDPTNLKFDDQFVNGAYSPGNATRQYFASSEFVYFDGSSGISYSSTFANGISYYAGAAMFHIATPSVAFNQSKDIRLNRKWVFNAGLSAPTSDFNKIILYADYFTQGGNSQMQGGFMYQHDLLQDKDGNADINVSGGAFLRWNDAVVPVIKLDYYGLGIGLTYDANISKLHTASQLRGGFELTLSYKNLLNIRNSSGNQSNCPKGL